MKINIKLNDTQFMRQFTNLEQQQLPYATARALTKTANDIGKFTSAKVRAKMEIQKPWAAKLSQGRIGGNPSPSAVLASMPADKKKGIERMQATVGTIGWQMAEQMDGKTTIRKPTGKAHYRWVPMQSELKHKPKKLKNYQNKLRQPTGKGRVFINTPNGGTGASAGQKVVFERTSKKREPIRALYLLKPEQEIVPGINFMKIVEEWAPKIFPGAFRNTMTEALKTAKPR